MGTWFQEEETMICVICKQAEPQNGKATVTLERAGMTLDVKGVAARVCPNCGEEYVDERVASELARTAEEAARSGIQVDILEYVAA